MNIRAIHGRIQRYETTNHGDYIISISISMVISLININNIYKAYIVHSIVLRLPGWLPRPHPTSYPALPPIGPHSSPLRMCRTVPLKRRSCEALRMLGWGGWVLTDGTADDFDDDFRPPRGVNRYGMDICVHTDMIKQCSTVTSTRFIR